LGKSAARINSRPGSLKERHAITRAQDVTLDLSVPARRPEQWTRRKAIPRADYLRVLAAIGDPHRDALTLLDATGWHVTELTSFIREGAIEVPPPGRKDGAAGVLICPQRKSGEMMRTVVGKEARAAAERLRARGVFSVGRFHDAIRATCKKTGDTATSYSRRTVRP
jgi:hypothetical protein